MLYGHDLYNTFCLNIHLDVVNINSDWSILLIFTFNYCSVLFSLFMYIKNPITASLGQLLITVQLSDYWLCICFVVIVFCFLVCVWLYYYYYYYYYYYIIIIIIITIIIIILVFYYCREGLLVCLFSFLFLFLKK